MPATPAGDETTTWLGALARSTQSAPECVVYNSEDLAPQFKFRAIPISNSRNLIQIFKVPVSPKISNSMGN